MKIRVEKDLCRETIRAFVVETIAAADADDASLQAWQAAPVGTVERAQKKYEAVLSAVGGLAGVLVNAGWSPDSVGAAVRTFMLENPAPMAVEPAYYMDLWDGGYQVRFPDVVEVEVAL